MTTPPGYVDAKADYLRRLRRIEGQVRGLQRMVSEDAYCIDVLTQVSAVNRAMQGVAVGLVQDHLSHCVTDAVGRAARDGPAPARPPRPAGHSSRPTPG